MVGKTIQYKSGYPASTLPSSPPFPLLGLNERATLAQLQRSRNIDSDQLPLIHIQPFSDQLLIPHPPVPLKDHQTRLSVREDQVYRHWISDTLQRQVIQEVLEEFPRVLLPLMITEGD
eukprot:Blabericola_migrator_1__2418@NODE_167_length_12152_cov_196_313198_g145_i0_p10_GENE_NODE_167_length_12152_cov_196_313198_g145_i0NODE_167_length_12152_cov_196_313198_g145_i0_p10_ORF_typecomplete_len118_score13_84_NODE_167_length_12152_cov_196_313198_g145_i0529882